MPIVKRFKTSYPGVYYIIGKSVANGREEKVYYIRYRRNGNPIEEKAGRQYQDDMSPARAARIRAQRIEGIQLSNKERREAEKEAAHVENKKWTIDKLWEEYKKQKTDSKSLRVDDNRYRNYLKPRFGNVEPKDLIQLDIDRMRIKALKRKKPQTVKHILALLQRIINFGLNKNLCQGIGFRIEYPEVYNEKIEDLTPDQLSMLFKVIKKDPNVQAANLMKMALFTGMRRGELFRLKWKDVDFHRCFILIRDPKGGPDQKIPLNDSAEQVLKNHPRTDSPFVFPGRGGKQRTDIKKQVNKIREKAGLPKDFRPIHGLRHVYASILASSGKVDMYTLQRLLTHKNSRMTQRYAHLRDEALRKASDLAADIIGEAATAKKRKNVVKLKKTGRISILRDRPE